METKKISISLIEPNKGQVEGLPANPRFVKDERFNVLKKSIIDAPEMLSLRELIVYQLEEERYVVIGGNMRLEACRSLGYKEVPCKVLPRDTDVDKLREYAIKDNVSIGETNLGVLQEWNIDELTAWGMEFGDVKEMTEDEFDKTFNSIKNADAVYPIVPKFDERHEVFIIISENEVDANYLRERLGMNKMKSYKRGVVSKSNVISIKDVIAAIYGQDSNTEPQES